MAAGIFRVTVTGRIGPGILAQGPEIFATRVDINFKSGVVDIYRDNPPFMTSFQISDINDIEFDLVNKTLNIA